MILGGVIEVKLVAQTSQNDRFTKYELYFLQNAHFQFILKQKILGGQFLHISFPMPRQPQKWSRNVKSRGGKTTFGGSSVSEVDDYLLSKKIKKWIFYDGTINFMLKDVVYLIGGGYITFGRPDIARSKYLLRRRFSA